MGSENEIAPAKPEESRVRLIESENNELIIELNLSQQQIQQENEWINWCICENRPKNH